MNSVKRKITRSGNGSYYVTLPRKFLRAIKVKEKQFVEVSLEKNSIKIKDWK